MKWVKANDKLWDKADCTVHKDLPELWASFMSIDIPPEKRHFYCFPLCILNINNQLGKHNDGKDKRKGLCFSIPFGKWRNGGDLMLHDLNIRVMARSGDFSGFQSFELEHSVTSYTGVRYSVILTSHDDMYFPPNPHREGKDTTVKNGYKQLK